MSEFYDGLDDDEFVALLGAAEQRQQHESTVLGEVEALLQQVTPTSRGAGAPPPQQRWMPPPQPYHRPALTPAEHRFNTPNVPVRPGHTRQGSVAPPLMNRALAFSPAGPSSKLNVMPSILDRSCDEVEEEDFRGQQPMAGAHEAQAEPKKRGFQSPYMGGPAPGAAILPPTPASKRSAPPNRAHAAATTSQHKAIKRTALFSGADLAGGLHPRDDVHAQPALDMGVPSSAQPTDELEVSLFPEPPPFVPIGGAAGGDGWGACVWDDDDDDCDGGDKSMLANERAAEVPREESAPTAPAPRRIDLDLTVEDDDDDVDDDALFPPLDPRRSTAATPASTVHASRAPNFAWNASAATVELAPDVSVPAMLARKLHPHQREGIVFLSHGIRGELVDNQHGVVLADVPGLGKSAQIIGTLLACRSWVKKALIVCPVSLVDNWINEFRKWAPDMQRPAKILGPSGASVISSFTSYHGPEQRIVISSYERLRGDTQRQLARAQVNLVVCDEAHRLKNAQTKCARRLVGLNPCQHASDPDPERSSAPPPPRGARLEPRANTHPTPTPSARLPLRLLVGLAADDGCRALLLTRVPPLPFPWALQGV
jgi:hypothetical protein